MTEEQQTNWKNRWVLKGLPEQLLDDMINEANTEYETEMGVWYFNRYAQVKVTVTDDELETGDFYLYVIQRADTVYFGKGSLESSELFVQVPCTEIVFQVIKMHVGETLQIKGYGYTIATVSKDAEIEVSVSDVCTPPDFKTLSVLINANAEMASWAGWTVVGAYHQVDNHQYCGSHSGSWQFYLYWDGYIEQELLFPVYRSWLDIFTVCLLNLGKVTLYFTDDTSKDLSVNNPTFTNTNLLTANADGDGLLFPEGKWLKKIRFTPTPANSLTVDDVRMNE